MNRHHAILRDDLNVSTPKIETMIEKSMEAVAEAIKKASGMPYIINIGKDLEVDEC